MKKLQFFLFVILLTSITTAQNIVSPAEFLSLKQVGSAVISPDGEWAAFTVIVPRKPDEKSGSAWSELWVANLKSGETRALILGAVSIRSIQFHPDGKRITFLQNKGSGTELFAISVDGGETTSLFRFDGSLRNYSWSPDGKTLAFSGQNPPSDQEKKLKSMGYQFIYFEEDWKHVNLYLVSQQVEGFQEPRQVTSDRTVLSFTWSPDGKEIAFSHTPRNLIDDQYTSQTISRLSVNDGKITPVSTNEGKLGNFDWSPDGKFMAYTAAFDKNDHAVSQLFVRAVSGGETKNLTPAGFAGHIESVQWNRQHGLLFLAAEGTTNTIYSINADGKSMKAFLRSSDAGFIVSQPGFSSNGKSAILTGSSPAWPSELFVWNPGEKPKRLTTTNDWLEERMMGKQEVIRYPARDGKMIEGILIYPVDYAKGKPSPMIVIVHGGPESHYSNGWITGYSTPGQVFAGMGYLTFYPNYRASTGYGPEFAKAGFGDAAGVEFDDIADGIRYLNKAGFSDSTRVGMMGGSYGGYASAWFGTYYTELVKAVHMFVGISNVISKTGSTDIPREELLVHAGKPIDETWEYSLQRSPIYHAGKSKTAFLISGGTEDTRIDPSQSLEMLRALQRFNHPAARLVQYPGEPHGNLKQTSRSDFLWRTVEWMNWYVRDQKPLNGPMPRLDISDRYGI